MVPASVVAVVMADSRLSTVTMRDSAWRSEPVKARASVVRVATSEEMVVSWVRTVAAVRFSTGAAEVRERRRRGTIVLMICILNDSLGGRLGKWLLNEDGMVAFGVEKEYEKGENYLTL